VLGQGELSFASHIKDSTIRSGCPVRVSVSLKIKLIGTKKKEKKKD
jgi:hypothetical protein